MLSIRRYIWLWASERVELKIISQWHIPFCRKHRRSCCRRRFAPHAQDNLTRFCNEIQINDSPRAARCVSGELFCPQEEHSLSLAREQSFKFAETPGRDLLHWRDSVLLSLFLLIRWKSERLDVSLKSWIHRGFYRQNARVYRRNAKLRDIDHFFISRIW